MRKQRVSSTFAPDWDEVEKRSGASTLMLVQAAGAALSVAGMPPVGNVDIDSARERSEPGEAAQGAESGKRAAGPWTIIPAQPAAWSTQVQVGLVPAPGPLSTPARAGAIRPMSLAPGGPSAASAPLTTPSQAGLAAGGGGAASVPGAQASEPGAPNAAPVVGLPSAANARSPRAPVPDSNTGGGTLGASFTGLSNATGGMLIGDGYAATGGLVRASSIAGLGSGGSPYGRAGDPGGMWDETLAQSSGGGSVAFNALTGLGSGPATGPYSGTGTGTISGDPTGGLSTPTGSTSAGGTYTIPAPSGGGASGGGASGGTTGRVHFSGGSTGPALIGGKQNLMIVADNGATLSNIRWSSSGTPVMYASQTVPNPKTATQFTNVAYTIGNQTASSISFFWGEKIGVETITVNADVTKDGKTVAAKPLTLKVNVCSPGVSGTVKASASASFARDGGALVMMYGTAQEAGVDWRALTPTKGGTFGVVQMLTGGSIVISSPTRPGGAAGFYNVDKTKNPIVYTPAPFPLVDVASTSTTPFYPGADDSPTADLAQGYNTVATMTFKDYVMYKPMNGIWVPEGTFTWTFKATATYTGGAPIPWRITTQTVPTKAQLTVKIDHTAWPSGWKGVAGDYLGYKVTLP